MTSVLIRPLQPSDVDRLIELVRKTGAFRPEEVDVAAELLEAGSARGEDSGYLFRVAEAQGSAPGHALGYACYGPTPCTEGTFDLYWIAVDPDFQGRDIASALLAGVEADIRARGGRLLVVETEDSGAYRPARAFYGARGFSAAAAVPDFYRPGAAKIIYTKPLEEHTGGH